MSNLSMVFAGLFIAVACLLIWSEQNAHTAFRFDGDTCSVIVAFDASLWYDRALHRFGHVGVAGYTTLPESQIIPFEDWLARRAKHGIFYYGVRPGNGIFETALPDNLPSGVVFK